MFIICLLIQKPCTLMPYCRICIFKHCYFVSDKNMIIYRKQNGFTRKLFSIAEKASDIFVRKEDKNIAKDPITKNRVDKVTVCNQSETE